MESILITVRNVLIVFEASIVPDELMQYLRLQSHGLGG